MSRRAGFVLAAALVADRALALTRPLYEDDTSLVQKAIRPQEVEDRTIALSRRGKQRFQAHNTEGTFEKTLQDATQEQQHNINPDGDEAVIKHLRNLRQRKETHKRMREQQTHLHRRHEAAEKKHWRQNNEEISTLTQTLLKNAQLVREQREAHRTDDLADKVARHEALQATEAAKREEELHEFAKWREESERQYYAARNNPEAQEEERQRRARQVADNLARKQAQKEAEAELQEVLEAKKKAKLLEEKEALARQAAERAQELEDELYKGLEPWARKVEKEKRKRIAERQAAQGDKWAAYERDQSLMPKEELEEKYETHNPDVMARKKKKDQDAVKALQEYMADLEAEPDTTANLTSPALNATGVAENEDLDVVGSAAQEADMWKSVFDSLVPEDEVSDEASNMAANKTANEPDTDLEDDDFFRQKIDANSTSVAGSQELSNFSDALNVTDAWSNLTEDLDAMDPEAEAPPEEAEVKEPHGEEPVAEVAAPMEDKDAKATPEQDMEPWQKKVYKKQKWAIEAKEEKREAEKRAYEQDLKTLDRDAFRAKYGAEEEDIVDDHFADHDKVDAVSIFEQAEAERNKQKEAAEDIAAQEAVAAGTDAASQLKNMAEEAQVSEKEAPKEEAPKEEDTAQETPVEEAPRENAPVADPSEEDSRPEDVESVLQDLGAETEEEKDERVRAAALAHIKEAERNKQKEAAEDIAAQEASHQAADIYKKQVAEDTKEARLAKEQAEMDMEERQVLEADRARQKKELLRQNMDAASEAARVAAEAQRVAEEAQEEAATHEAVRRADSFRHDFELEGGASSMVMSDFVEAFFALPKAVKDPVFVSTVESAGAKLEAAAARYGHDAMKIARKFATDTATVPDHELIAYLISTFDAQAKLLDAHHQTAKQLGKEVIGHMPKDLVHKLEPMQHLVLAAFSPLNVNTSVLKDTEPASACTELSAIMANVTSYNSHLLKVNKMLNSTSEMAPMLNMLTPTKSMTKEVKTFVKKALTFAYVETLGLSDASNELVEKVGTVVANRLSCTWSGSSRSHSGLSFMWAAMAVFLATRWLF